MLSTTVSNVVFPIELVDDTHWNLQL